MQLSSLTGNLATTTSISKTHNSTDRYIHMNGNTTISEVGDRQDHVELSKSDFIDLDDKLSDDSKYQ